AVVMPAIWYPAILRTPPVRKQIFVAVEHPLKIYATIDLIGEVANIGFVKALLDSQNAAQKQRRIDRRDLAVPTPIPGRGIHPVIEPAVLILSAIGKKIECDTCPP